MNNPKIGWRYRHLKRGSIYVVRGVVNAAIHDVKDGDSGFFVVSADTTEYGEGPSYDLTKTLAQCAYPDDIVFMMPLTHQISETYKKLFADFVIYQCEEDGRLWARPLAEFVDGRFERIKE